MKNDSNIFIIPYTPIESINNNLKDTTKNDILLNLSKREKFRLYVQHLPEAEFLDKKDFIIFSQKDTYLEGWIRRINGLVPYEKWIKIFFADYLKLKINYSPVGLRISFENQPTGYFNIGFLLNSVCDAITTNKFKDYNNFSDYGSFCENLLLNILQNNIYEHKNQSFFVVYLLLLLKNPNSSFIIRNNYYSSNRGYYISNVFSNFKTITSLLYSKDEIYIIYKDTVLQIKGYLSTVINRSNLNSNIKAQMKRNSSNLATKIIGNIL